MDCYELLRQVDELLHCDAMPSSVTQLHAPPVSAPWQPSPSIDSHSVDKTASVVQSSSPSMLRPPSVRVTSFGGDNDAPMRIEGVQPPVVLPRNAAIQEAIDEVLDPASQAESVIQALLATARHNTDLTELDLVTRRIRQSEIEQLSAAIGLLQAQDKYLRKRCNLLYDRINAVNDQQAVLVSCLEEALRVSVTGPTAAATSSSFAPADPTSARGKTSSRIPDLDESSQPGSLKPGSTVAQRALLGTTSSASSLSGPATAPRGVTVGLTTNRAGSQHQAGTAAAAALQPANNHSAAVSPYQVVGGALNRDMLLANILARR